MQAQDGRSRTRYEAWHRGSPGPGHWPRQIGSVRDSPFAALQDVSLAPDHGCKAHDCSLATVA